MAIDDPTTVQAPASQSNSRTQQQRPVVSPANVNMAESSSASLSCGRRGASPIHRLAHHMGNSLQAIRGEVDLLHVTGALPQRSFDNITQGIERLTDLLNEIDGLPSVTPGRVIEKIDLPKSGGDHRSVGVTGTTLAQWLEEKEKQFIAQKLEECGGSIALTAGSCDIGLRSLYRKMQKYGLDKKRFKLNGAPVKPITTKSHRSIAEAARLDPDPPRTL